MDFGPRERGVAASGIIEIESPFIFTIFTDAKERQNKHPDLCPHRRWECADTRVGGGV